MTKKKEQSAIDAIYEIAETLSRIGKSPVRENIDTKEVKSLIVGKIKAFGYIVNKSKQPIPDVVVNIYGGGSEVIRSLKTNIDGHWNARLPSGKYGIEYLHKKFKPINRTITLDDSQVEYEVK